MLYNDAAGIFITCTWRTRIDTCLFCWFLDLIIKYFFHFLQKTPTSKKTKTASHQPLRIFLLPVQASTLALSFEPAHTSPPLQTKKNPSACAEHITRKSVTAWQVIAPNGCQPAEMWGGHCEKRSETRGERPSLVLALSPSVSFGSEPDLTSKSSQDMNSLWRAHPVKVDATQTCTMPKIYAHKKKENHRDWMVPHLSPLKWTYGRISHRKFTVTIALTAVWWWWCSSCQIKKK